jgi:hypothetical protein
MEDEDTFNRYKNEYGFIGEFNMDVMARPEVSNKYFFNDKEFNTMYIGNVMNIDRAGNVTLVLQEYVPNINTGEVMNKRFNSRNNRFFENGSIVILNNNSFNNVNNSLNNVEAYLIPNTNYDSDTSTVGYISNTEDEDDEFEEEFKRRLTFNEPKFSKKSRLEGGKKRKSSKKSKKTFKRRKTRKAKRRKH